MAPLIILTLREIYYETLFKIRGKKIEKIFEKREPKMKKIASTFGGSAFLPESSQYQEGIQLGRFLVEKDYIVKCGGYYGLMEAISKGVSEAGGICIGITNATFDPKLSNEFVTKEMKQADIFDRLRELIVESDLIIAQEGSLGTLAEVILVWFLLYVRSIECRVCLIGKSWKPAIEGLRSLPIQLEHFSILEIYDSMDDFVNAPSTSAY